MRRNKKLQAIKLIVLCIVTVLVHTSVMGNGMGIVNIRDFGVAGDGITDDTAALEAAITAADENVVLIPAGTYRITGDVTVPGNVALWFANGGKLSIDSGVTVTINGHIQDIISQIFSGDGIVAGTPKVDFVRPEWWGAVGDGSTDDYSAIDAAVDFADQSSSIKVVRFRAANYIVETALSYSIDDGNTYRGITLLGVTQSNMVMTSGTVITFKNIATDTPGLSLLGNGDGDRLRDWLISNIKFTTSGTQARNAIYTYRLTNSQFINCTFHDFDADGIWINGSWALKFDRCYAYMNGSAGFHIGASWIIEFTSTDSRDNEYGIYVNSCQNVNILGGNFEANDSYAIWIAGGYSRAIHIMGGYLEALGGTVAIHIASCGYSTIFPFYGATAYDLELSANTDHITVLGWRGDIDIGASSSTEGHTIVSCAGDVTIGTGVTGVQILNCDGTVTDNSGNDTNVNLNNALLSNGSVDAESLRAYLLTVVDDVGAPTVGDLVNTNGTFDSDTSGWTAYKCSLSSVAAGQSGNCLQLDNTYSGEPGARQTVSTKPGSMYKLSYYFKLGTDDKGVVKVGTTAGGSDLYYENTLTDADWTLHEGYFTAPGSAVYLSAGGYKRRAAACYYDTVAIQRVNEGYLAVGNHLSVTTMSGEVIALSFADPIACDMDAGTVFTLTTTADCTINASNGTAGQRTTFIITDDATGGHVVTFGTNFKPNGTLTGTAGKTATADFVYDGTIWYEVSRTSIMLMGDVTQDSRITSNDAMAILQWGTNLVELKPEQLEVADVSANSIISAYDAGLIYQYSLGLIEEFPAANGAPTAPVSIVANTGKCFLELRRNLFKPDTELTIMVNLENADGVIGVDLALEYNQAVLAPVEVSTLPYSDYLVGYGSKHGKLLISLAASRPIQNGPLVEIKFRISPDATRITSSIWLSRIILNESSIEAYQAVSFDVSPYQFALLQNYPNPCNPETWIPYHLMDADSVSIMIFNATGKLVRTLDLEHKDAGIYTSQSKAAYWDGKNEAGEEVTSGVYFYNITAGDFSATRKMVVKK